MGGARITFTGVTFDCLGNSNFFVNRGGSGATTSLPHGAVAWHSDGMETARHLVVPAIQLHLGVLLMILGLLPAAATTTPERPPADGVASAHG